MAERGSDERKQNIDDAYKAVMEAYGVDRAEAENIVAAYGFATLAMRTKYGDLYAKDPIDGTEKPFPDIE